MSAADVTERDVERAFAEHGRRLGARYEPYQHRNPWCIRCKYHS